MWVFHQSSASSAVQEPASSQSSNRRPRISARAGRSSGCFARQCRIARSRDSGTASSVLREGGTGSLLQVSQHRCRGAILLKHQAAGDEPVRHAAQRVEIGPAIEVRSSHGQLGRHVGGVPVVAPSPVKSAPSPQHFDQAEIEDLGEVIFVSHAAKKNVGGFDVAMNHAVTVSVGERPADLTQDTHDSRRRLRPKPFTRVSRSMPSNNSIT